MASTANELLAHFAILSSTKKTETSFHAQKANLKIEKENEEMVDQLADKTTVIDFMIIYYLNSRQLSIPCNLLKYD